MAAKAEHVCPGGQPQVFQTREFAEPDALGNVAAGVVSNGQRAELVGGADAPCRRAQRLPTVLGNRATDVADCFLADSLDL